MSGIQKARCWSPSNTNSIPVPSGNTSRPDNPWVRCSWVSASSTGQVAAPMDTRGKDKSGVGAMGALVGSAGDTGAGSAVGISVAAGNGVASTTGVAAGRSVANGKEVAAGSSVAGPGRETVGASATAGKGSSHRQRRGRRQLGCFRQNRQGNRLGQPALGTGGGKSKNQRNDYKQARPHFRLLTYPISPRIVPKRSRSDRNSTAGGAGATCV